FIGEGAPRIVLAMEPELPNRSYGQLLIRLESADQVDEIVRRGDAYLRQHFPEAEPRMRPFSLASVEKFKLEARFSGPDPAVLRSLAAEAAHADAPGRVALWRGSTHVGDDARAVGWAYARLARPLGLTLLEVDERGEFGAFADTLAARDRLLDPTTPATVAAVDAGDDGPPWLTLTLAAIVDTRRLAVILPAGAAPADVAVAGSAFAAVLAHHRGVAVCHSVG
ncbi:MAG: hypothetical protein ACLFTL_02370, partial [Alphaproteobacteria bacterium]